MAPYASSNVQQIAIAVVEDRGRYLVGRRPAGVALAGLWEFPGGKVQPGETPAEAAARECLEETGLVVEPLECLSVVRHAYAHGEVELHFWSCRGTGAPRADAAFAWRAKDELRTLEFPAANAEIIKRLTEEEEE